MARRWKVALIEPDPWVEDDLASFFRCMDCELRVFRAPADAQRELAEGGADIVLCDYWLPGRDGLSLLVALKRCHPEAVCILTAACLPPGTRTDAEELGIHTLFRNPFAPSELTDALVPVFRAGNRRGEAGPRLAGPGRAASGSTSLPSLRP